MRPKTSMTKSKSLPRPIDVIAALSFRKSRGTSMAQWSEMGAALFALVLFAACQSTVMNPSNGSAANLENIDWQVIGFGKLRMSEALPDREMYLRLRSDGRRMRAFDGCNGIYANYRLSDEQLHFVNVGRTDWVCSEAPEQLDLFMKLLASSASWSVFGAELELYDAKNELLVRFRSGRETESRN